MDASTDGRLEEDEQILPWLRQLTDSNERSSDEKRSIVMPLAASKSALWQPDEDIRLEQYDRTELPRNPIGFFQHGRPFQADKELLNFQVQRLRFVKKRRRKLPKDGREKFSVDEKTFIVRMDHGCVLRVISEEEPFFAVVFTSIFMPAVSRGFRNRFDGGLDLPFLDENEPHALRFTLAEGNVAVDYDGTMTCTGSSFNFRGEHFKIIFFGSGSGARPTGNNLPESTEVWALQSLVFYPSCRYVTAQQSGSVPFKVEEGNLFPNPHQKHLFVRTVTNGRISFQSVLNQRYLAFNENGQLISSTTFVPFSFFSEVAIGSSSPNSAEI
eukprot:m.12373 g.12373  ORF g.12373 m.12373 type:complete len:327 (+) comp24001_c0_seq1:614-1594(+)